MIDITAKRESLRRASGVGYVYAAKETIQRIKNDDLPKGNLLDVARAAGLLGAKQTPALIPHCHPIPIYHLDIKYTLEETAVRIDVEAASIGPTGLEMEVLTAVSVTALTIYDLLKPIDKAMSIGGIELLSKSGGKSDPRYSVKEGSVEAAVLVCSDTVSSGEKEDRSGLVLKELLEKQGVAVKDYRIVADEPELIKEAVLGWVEAGIGYIFTSGGTGLGPRDVTVDTVKELCEKNVPGLAEAMRAYGDRRMPRASLSRSYAGTIGQTTIVCMPGSSNGVRESMQAILPGVFHARKMLRGGGH